jgi:RHS repeat-associated protein
VGGLESKVPASITYRTGTAVAGASYSSTSTETESFTYTALGDLETRTDRRGITATFRYDLRRRQWKTEAPGSLSTDPIAVTQKAFTLNDDVASVTDARGHTTDLQYNAQGRLLTTTLPAVGGAARHVITQTYDLADRVSDTQAPGNRTTHVDFNNAGQPLTVTFASGMVMNARYDGEGRGFKTTDGLARDTITSYSNRSEPRFLTQPNGDVIEQRYDAAGRNIKLINRKQNEWTFGYDGAGRPTTFACPTSRVSSTIYTTGSFAPGNFVQPKNSVTLPSGKRSEVLYDAAGRVVTSVLYATPVATTPLQTINYTSDANGNVLTASLGAAVITRTYDQRNAVKSYRNERNEQFGYRYDANGNLVQLTFPDGKTVTYLYDERDRLMRVTDWANRQTNFSYDTATGDFTGFTRPNGTQRVLGYDNGGRLIRIEERKPGGRLIAMVRLGFDAAGRMEKRFLVPLPTDSTFPATGYTFNADNWINELPHDADGHLLRIPPAPVGTAYYPVQQMQSGLVNTGANNLGWDDFGRFSSAVRRDGSTQYNYDLEGNRSSTIATHSSLTWVPGTFGVPGHYTTVTVTSSTYHTWNAHGLSGMPELSMEAAVQGTPDRWYVWGGAAGLLYDVTAYGGGELLRYYHADQVGSTIALSGDTGEVMQRFEYTPYGLTIRAEGGNTTPFQFNGGYGVLTDNDTGLISMRARWYSPWLGRFISEDPTGFGGGMNMFAFAGGNPLSRIDPTGFNDQGSNTAFAANDWASAMFSKDAPRPRSAQELFTQGQMSVEQFEGGTADGHYHTVPAIDPVDLVAGLVAGGARSLGRASATSSAANTIDTAAVRFTQDNIRSTFKNGQSINDVAAALRNGSKAASEFPPIRLVEQGGQLFSLDNRRLATFSAAGRQVPFRMATAEEIGAEWARKFTTTEEQGWGQYISVRP